MTEHRTASILQADILAKVLLFQKFANVGGQGTNIGTFGPGLFAHTFDVVPVGGESLHLWTGRRCTVNSLNGFIAWRPGLGVRQCPQVLLSFLP